MANRPRRPSIVISTRFSPAEVAQIDAWAAAGGCSRSELIRWFGRCVAVRRAERRQLRALTRSEQDAYAALPTATAKARFVALRRAHRRPGGDR